jgi:hypothetical protein
MVNAPIVGAWLLGACAIYLAAARSRPPRRPPSRGVTTALSLAVGVIVAGCLLAVATRTDRAIELGLAGAGAICSGLLIWLSRGPDDDDGRDPRPLAGGPPPGWDWREFDRVRSAWERRGSRAPKAPVGV